MSRAAALALLLLSSACEKDPTRPPPPPGVREITPFTSFLDPAGIALDFIVNPQEKGSRGYYFEGMNWGTPGEELAGRAECIKEGGWLRIGETFCANGARDRFEPCTLFAPFAGVALNIYAPLEAEPSIGYPPNTSQTWTTDTVHVDCGDGNLYDRAFTYTLAEAGEVALLLEGDTLRAFPDAIRLRGRPMAGDDSLRIWLAPNVGILYAVYTECATTTLACLVGYNVANEEFTTGLPLTDYLPLAWGNHWRYDFSPDFDAGEDPASWYFQIAEGPR